MTHLGEHITDFVFGELSASEMDEARRHIAGCEACRQEVEQFERTRSMLKMLPDVEPPRSIVFEVERPGTAWRWLVPVAAAAAILIAVLIALPTQVQWRDSQLTIAFGKTAVQPVSTPVTTITTPATVAAPAP